jgi:hypothetical protein
MVILILPENAYYHYPGGRLYGNLPGLKTIFLSGSPQGGCAGPACRE